MKKILLFLVAVLQLNLLRAQAPLPPSLNEMVIRPAYIDEITLKVGGVKSWADLNWIPTGSKIVTRNYVDGLSRQLQQVAYGQGNSTNPDLISFYVYDAFGNQKKKYLPYAANTGMLYQSTPVVSQASFYATSNTSGKYTKDDAPYAEIVFDNSPLNKVFQEGSEGSRWQLGTGKIKTSISRTNTAADYVRQFNADGTSSGYWGAGKLYVEELIDEEGNKTVVFIDEQKRPILTRQIIDETIQGQHKDYKDKYTVYQLSGLVSLIIPPNVVDRLKNGSWTMTSDDIDNNVYKCEYDSKGRLVAKKTPSSGWVYMVYDKLDRIVMLQKPEQTANNKWFFIKYDKLGRKVMEGILQDNSRTSRQLVQENCDTYDYLNSSVAYYESRSGIQMGYSDMCFPQSSGGFTSYEILTVYFYDSYDLDNNGTEDYNYQSQSLGIDEPIIASAQGKNTAIKSKILGTNNWITKVYFYDKEGQIVQSLSNNITNLSVGDVHTNVFDFAGLLKRSIKRKNINSITETIKENMTHDAVGRTTAIRHQYNSNSDNTIVEYAYNELGQLVDKNLGKLGPDNYLQSVDLRYNIRGWMSHINNSDLTNDGYNTETNDVFGMEFLYENSDGGNGINNTGIFNGGMSGVKWRAKMNGHTFDNISRAYIYSYDKLGQLRNAIFNANNGSGWGYKYDAYSEKGISYDLNGNILTVQRNTWTGAVSSLDNLTYSYKSIGGNDRLLTVTDANGPGSYGFKTQSGVSDQYLYDDASGSLQEDKNRGVSYTYNELGKVERVTLSGSNRYIEYGYTAFGELVSKIQVDNGTIISSTSYSDDFVTVGNVLSYVNTIEGRIRTAGGVGTYEYYIKDNLDNVRISFENQGGVAVVRQENSFYAYGLAHDYTPIISGENKNLYNGGSEWQNDFGNDPDLYNTSLRQYDPVLGRFNGVDIVAENYSYLSVYQFAFNNPVSYNDPSGADPLPPGSYYPGDPVFQQWMQDAWGLFNTGGTYDQYFGGGWLQEVTVYGIRSDYYSTGRDYYADRGFNAWYQNSLHATTQRDNGYEETLLHKYSQEAKGVATKVLAVVKPIEQAFKRASLYSKPNSGKTALVIFEKTVLGRKIIHQPLFEMNALKAGKVASTLKTVGRIAGGVSGVLAVADMAQNGISTSNSLDLVMSAMAVSGVGSGIAGTYFLLNSASIIFTGKDIGQHIDDGVKYVRENY